MGKITNLYAGLVESNQNQIDSLLLLTSQIDGIQLELWRLKAEREIDQGRPVRSLVYYLWIAKKEIDRGMPFNVMLVLDQILGGLEAVDPADSMNDLASYERQALGEFMESYRPNDEHEIRMMNRIRTVAEDINAKAEARHEALARLIRRTDDESPAEQRSR